MKNRITRCLSILLASALILGLTACGSSGKSAESELASAQAEAESEPASAQAEAESELASAQAEAEQVGALVGFEGADVNLYILSGPTGIGAMNLWSASDAGETTNRYNITMPGANDEVVAAVSNGEADIACVATNLAATLYNKTKGQVTCLFAATRYFSSFHRTIPAISDTGYMHKARERVLNIRRLFQDM